MTGRHVASTLPGSHRTRSQSRQLADALPPPSWSISSTLTFIHTCSFMVTKWLLPFCPSHLSSREGKGKSAEEIGTQVESAPSVRDENLPTSPPGLAGHGSTMATQRPTVDWLRLVEMCLLLEWVLRSRGTCCCLSKWKILCWGRRGSWEALPMSSRGLPRFRAGGSPRLGAQTLNTNAARYP